VPNASSPRAARSRASGTCSSSQCSLDDQSGCFAHVAGEAFGAKLGAQRGGAAILPDDAVMDGIATGAIPNDSGFTLVRDADGGDRLGTDLVVTEELLRHAELAQPDVVRIVLNPAGARVCLWKLPRNGRSRPALRVEEDGPRACRSLVECQDILPCHLAPPSRYIFRLVHSQAALVASPSAADLARDRSRPRRAPRPQSARRCHPSADGGYCHLRRQSPGMTAGRVHCR
jgi:hypothetical protein